MSTTTITATRVTNSRVPANRMLYRLSEPTTTEAFNNHGTSFQHVIVSLGRSGDTCAFPASEEGRVLDFCGFGFGLGVRRLLEDAEIDRYMAECIAQHEADGGIGMSGYGDRELA